MLVELSVLGLFLTPDRSATYPTGKMCGLAAKQVQFPGGAKRRHLLEWF